MWGGRRDKAMDDIRHCFQYGSEINTGEQSLARMEPTIMWRQHTEKCMPNWEVTTQFIKGIRTIQRGRDAYY